MGSLELFDDFDPMQDIDEKEAKSQYERYDAVVNYLDKAKEASWRAAMRMVCEKIVDEAPSMEQTEDDSKILLTSGKSRVVT